jgi:hypothetical protein
MRIASDICRVASGSRSFLLIFACCTIDRRLSSRLDTRCDQLDLVDTVMNGPIASGLANDIDQFEERALIPILSDLLNLSIRIEGNNVNLWQSVSTLQSEQRGYTRSGT